MVPIQTRSLRRVTSNLVTHPVGRHKDLRIFMGVGLRGGGVGGVESVVKASGLSFTRPQSRRAVEPLKNKGTTGHGRDPITGTRDGGFGRVPRQGRQVSPVLPPVLAVSLVLRLSSERPCPSPTTPVPHGPPGDGVRDNPRPTRPRISSLGEPSTPSMKEKRKEEPPGRVGSPPVEPRSHRPDGGRTPVPSLDLYSPLGDIPSWSPDPSDLGLSVQGEPRRRPDSTLPVKNRDPTLGSR